MSWSTGADAAYGADARCATGAHVLAGHAPPGPGETSLPPIVGPACRRPRLAGRVLLASRLPECCPQKGGGWEDIDLPVRPVHRSACSRPTRNPLMLSQPSSQTLLFVVQVWISAALRTPHFLEAVIRARLHAQWMAAIKKHHVRDANAAKFGVSAAPSGELPLMPRAPFRVPLGPDLVRIFRVAGAGLSLQCLR